MELYNAVANRNYSDPELLTINTLENAVYMSMKNDLSFIIDLKVSLYEQQSTYNPNMPLRFLMYLSDVYSEMVATRNLYGRSQVKLYTPQFVVFYNGIETRPEKEVLKLSDAYEIKQDVPSLELKVTVLNINNGYNEELKNACKTLSDYAEYVGRVRFHKSNGLSIEDAVDLAIEECIKEDKLREFLIKNRSEAKAVSIYEYNEEEHIRMERAESREAGRAEEIIRLLRRFGKTEEEIVSELVEVLKISVEEAREYCMTRV